MSDDKRSPKPPVDTIWFFKDKVSADFPFQDYYLLGPYWKHDHSKSWRRHIMLISKNSANKKRITMHFSRYLLCVKEKRILKTEEQCDHIDNDKHNDIPENLQILTRKENERKGKIFNHYGPQWLILKCPECGRYFAEVRNKCFTLLKKNKYKFCSYKCSGHFGLKTYPFQPKEYIIEEHKSLFNEFEIDAKRELKKYTFTKEVPIRTYKLAKEKKENQPPKKKSRLVHWTRKKGKIRSRQNRPFSKAFFIVPDEDVDAAIAKYNVPDSVPIKGDPK